MSKDKNEDASKDESVDLMDFKKYIRLPPNDSPHRTRGRSRDAWDESCFLYIKQSKIGRAKGIPPATRMVCFSKRTEVDENGDERELYQITHSEDFGEAIEHVHAMNHSGNTVMKGPALQKDTAELMDTHHFNVQEIAETSAEKTRDYFVKIYAPYVRSFKNYAESWTDGRQVSSFQRFSNHFMSTEPVKMSGKMMERLFYWITTKSGSGESNA